MAGIKVMAGEPVRGADRRQPPGGVAVARVAARSAR
jgi:hypothetical protein